METGAIDDKQLVTIRGVCHYTHCSLIYTRLESTNDIMYHHRSLPKEKEGVHGKFLYMTEFNFLSFLRN